MKIRAQFVANSSSSSFLIYGVHNPQVSIEKLLASLEDVEDKWAAWYKGEQEKYQERHPDWYSNTIFEAWVKEWIEEESFGELLCELGNFVDLPKLEYHVPFGEVYLGADPRTMADDETMCEFKQRTRDALALFIEGGFKCGWHEEAWRNG